MAQVIRLKSNWTQLNHELDRLEKAPAKAKVYLDAVLTSGFQATQAAVHVETGSLKSSGKKSSSMVGDEWRGEIEYGGVSTGINNPVTYAIYEKARGTTWAGPSSVKGDHNFMAPLDALDSLYVKAILKAMS